MLPCPLGPKVCNVDLVAVSAHRHCQSSKNLLQNSAKVAALKPFERILPGFPVIGYTCSPFNCYRTRSPRPQPPSHPVSVRFQIFFCYFYSSSCFHPISLLGILPCIIHEWHACFTRHVLTALLWRPEGVSTKPACNLLTQGAASSQLSSPITFISWTGPSPWHQVCCDHCVI